MDMTMEPRYLPETGKLEESSGTARRGVVIRLFVCPTKSSNGITEAPIVGTVESCQRYQMHLA